jgi:CRISPR/Cas system CSM-associated protein Csm3 (group 7 of RAMP superfamily)
MDARDHLIADYRLEFAGPVHCGTGLRAGLVDHTVTRGPDKAIRIPGSTVKGMARWQCEWLCRLALPPEEREVSFDALIEDIFGSKARESTLFWDDALPEDLLSGDALPEDAPPKDVPSEEPLKWYPGPSRTRVALSRLTRTAEPGRLFTREQAPEGMTFLGRVFGWLGGPPLPKAAYTYGLPLLVAGLVLVDQIGAARSTGLGRCRTTLTCLQVNGQPVEPADIVRHIDDLEYYNIARQEG